MRKPVVVAAIALAVLAVAVPRAAGDQPREDRLDELHTTRPAAAALQQHHATLVHYYEAVERAQVEAFLAAAAEAVAEAEVRASARSTQTATAGDSGSWLECTRRIESNGDYGAVSPGGTYRGAYQFHRETWNRTAADAGRHDLVGVDPATVAPADQDAMALQRYDGGRGASHWGGRCT